MSFSFQPLTDEQLNDGKPVMEFELLPVGIYDFYVKLAEEKLSSNGNPMMKLVLSVYDEKGRETQIFDNLVSTPKALFKIKQFCDAVGLADKYNLGCLEYLDCINKHGKANIIVQKGEPKTDGSFYKDKNVVKYYVKATANDSVIASQPKKLADNRGAVVGLDDDIPF